MSDKVSGCRFKVKDADFCQFFAINVQCGFPRPIILQNEFLLVEVSGLFKELDKFIIGVKNSKILYKFKLITYGDGVAEIVACLVSVLHKESLL